MQVNRRNGGEAASELSRGDVLLKGALAVGALYGIGAVAPFVSRALAIHKGDEVGILNYLLYFEYLQVSIANRASTEVNNNGEKMPLAAREKELLQLLIRQDGEHVAALKAMIEEKGGKPDKKGGYVFSYTTFSQALGVSATIEGTSVGALNGAVALLESDEARELIYSMVQTDARHAATVRIGGQEEPSPEPFDHAVPEQDSMFHVVQYTGVYPEEPDFSEE